MTQHLDAKTMPEFFGRRYDSLPLQVAASAISFTFLIPYTASLFNGLSRLFDMAFHVKINFRPYISLRASVCNEIIKKRTKFDKFERTPAGYA